jgi:thiol-disulfide isomerase/thioredoxin
MIKIYTTTLSFITLICLLGSCKQTEKSDNIDGAYATLYGTISVSPELESIDNIPLYQFNYALQDRVPIASITLDKPQKEYQIKLKIDKPALFQLAHQGIFMSPHDSVHLNISIKKDAHSDLPKTIFEVLTSRNKGNYLYYQQFSDPETSSLLNINIEDYLQNFSQYKARLKEEYDFRRNQFNNFSIQYPVSNEFKSWILNDLKFQYFDGLLSTLYYTNPTTLDADFFKEIKISFQQNDSLLHMVSYGSFCLNYIWQYKNQIKNGNDYWNNLSSLNSLTHSINTNFKGTTRDYLLYTLLRDIAENKNQRYDFSIQQFFYNTKNQIKDSLFIKAVNHLNFTESNLSIPERVRKLSLENSVGEQSELNNILKKHKGKIIFVDFWASWCSPCIAEFGSLKKIIRSYKKEMVFINISIDSEQSKWQKSAQKNLPKELNHIGF